MRPTAEILKRILPVRADNRLLLRFVPILVDAPLLQASNQLQLVGLVGKQLAGLVSAHLAVYERMLAADDLAHALLDRFQILRRKADQLALRVTAQVKVVIKARVDWRADRDLRLGIELQHSLRHHMGRAVAELVQLILFGTVVGTHDSLLVVQLPGILHALVDCIQDDVCYI